MGPQLNDMAQEREVRNEHGRSSRIPLPHHDPFGGHRLGSGLDRIPRSGPILQPLDDDEMFAQQLTGSLYPRDAYNAQPVENPVNSLPGYAAKSNPLPSLFCVSIMGFLWRCPNSTAHILFP